MGDLTASEPLAASQVFRPSRHAVLTGPDLSGLGLTVSRVALHWSPWLNERSPIESRSRGVRQRAHRVLLAEAINPLGRSSIARMSKPNAMSVLYWPPTTSTETSVTIPMQSAPSIAP